MSVHKTAILSGDVTLAEDVEIGPFSVIRGPVTIGQGTVVDERVTITGPTEIGRNNRICCGALVGGDPQDLSFKGGTTYLKVGDNNTIREYVTIHRGTAEGSSTIIGDNNLFMGLVHIGHNCVVGNNVIIGNNSLLAGHVSLFDQAIISGQVVIHQFVRVGRLGMAAGLSRIGKDILPFMTAVGESSLLSLNVVGLRRAGYSQEDRMVLQKCFKLLFRSNLTTTEALKTLADNPEIPAIQEILDFLQDSKRGFCHYRRLSNISHAARVPQSEDNHS